MSTKPIRIDRKLVRKGDKIEIVTNTPKQEINSKDVLFNIAQLQKAISEDEQTIIQLNDNLSKVKDAIVKNNETMKLFTKYADWARTVQESKFKAVVESVEQSCFDKVQKEYKNDEALTEEQNSKQKYHQYRQYVATHQKISDVIASDIIQAKLFDENYLENPWK